MRHNDGIPIAGGDFGKEPLSVLFGEICFVCYKDIGVRIQFVEFIAPLMQQMVGLILTINNYLILNVFLFKKVKNTRIYTRKNRGRKNIFLDNP